MDYEKLSSQFLRAIRGSRSQRAFGRWLGYRSNVCAAWETGRRYPTASETFRIMQRAGIDVLSCWNRFFFASPNWLANANPEDPTFVSACLREFRGRRTVTELARVTGLNRFVVARALKGRGRPRLPTFFQLVHGLSTRLLDLLAQFVDIDRLPVAAGSWQTLEAHRRLAYDQPMFQAASLALGLEEYKTLAAHRPGFIAQRVGCTLQQEDECIAAMAKANVIRWDKGKWWLTHTGSIDTGRDPNGALRLKQHWATVALGQLDRGGNSVFAYRIFSVSKKRFAELREKQRRYYQQFVTSISEPDDAPDEVIGVSNLQIFELPSEAHR